jgi:hypothetical protein
LLVVSADMPGTAAVLAQCPRTGDAMAAAAGRIVSTLVAPASASETPTLATPANILIFAMLMPVIMRPPLKRR